MELLTIGQAARMLGVSVPTLRAWSNKGLIETVKLPTGVRRYRPESVEEFRRRMVVPEAKARASA